jgi:hypothetical protein
MPPGEVGFRATGEIEREDYDEVWCGSGSVSLGIPIRTDLLRCRTGSGRDVTIASEHSATRSLGGPKPVLI